MALTDIPPMLIRLMNDSQELIMKFDSEPHSWSAEQVETLIIALMHYRSKMLPSVAGLGEYDKIQADRIMVADSFELNVDPANSCLQVWGQHAGFGWSCVNIPALEAAKLGQELLDLAKTQPIASPATPLQ